MMKSDMPDIDSYIEMYPKDVRIILQKLRAVIAKAAPTAKETISYAMPTFKMNKNLVHFAAYKNHIGFYPTSSGIREFQKEISKYKNSKGAVQFPIDAPLPMTLITRIVKFRVKEDLGRARAKAIGKK